MKKIFCFLLLSYGAVSGYAQQLTPSMPAPALQVGNWVKGEPITGFSADSTYVVEFWATWCGPCKQAIPHLTELADKYPQTRFIGVSVWESNTGLVQPFVEKMGSTMDYTVAIDKQESETARQGYMTKNWLEAAGLNGIPATFIVDKKNIVWIGHPMMLDSVLGAVTARKWDAKAFAKKWKKDKEEEAALNAQMKQYTAKLQAHAKDKEKKQFYKTLEAQMDFMTKKFGPSTVNELVWNWIADPAGKALTPEMKDYDFAIRSMEKLIASPEGKNPAFYDTLAWCYFGSGNKEKAIELEKAALQMLPATYAGRGEYEKALNTFQQ